MSVTLSHRTTQVQQGEQLRPQPATGCCDGGGGRAAVAQLRMAERLASVEHTSGVTLSPAVTISCVTLCWAVPDQVWVVL